jgi:hypothetical protein
MKKSSTLPNAYGIATEVCATVTIVSDIFAQTPPGTLPIEAAIAPTIPCIHRGVQYNKNSHAQQSERRIASETYSLSFEDSLAIQ